MCVLLDLRGSRREASPRKDELGWEFANYAPEKKRVQEKIKKVENFS
jgi:hypothetical protein